MQHRNERVERIIMYIYVESHIAFINLLHVTSQRIFHLILALIVWCEVKIIIIRICFDFNVSIHHCNKYYKITRANTK